MKRLLQDKKSLIILLLTILFLIRAHGQNLRYALWILGGVAIAASCDMLINKISLHRKIIPKSAIISGFITAGIIDHNQPWFILIVFSALAILSKYIIRFKDKHIFNPANFALFAAVLFRIPLTWSIESNVFIIIATGLYIAYSLKKLPHIFGFLVFFIGLFLAQGINPFLLVSWFFVFVMLIEPKTSGFGRLRGFIFGSVAGIVSFIVFNIAPQYDLFVSSLFAVNLCNPLLEKVKNRKEEAS